MVGLRRCAPPRSVSSTAMRENAGWCRLSGINSAVSMPPAGAGATGCGRIRMQPGATAEGVPQEQIRWPHPRDPGAASVRAHKNRPRKDRRRPPGRCLHRCTARSGRRRSLRRPQPKLISTHVTRHPTTGEDAQQGGHFSSPRGPVQPRAGVAPSGADFRAAVRIWSSLPRRRVRRAPC